MVLKLLISALKCNNIFLQVNECFEARFGLIYQDSDILTAADRGDLSMLTLLDLSSAFDTVDHPILLCRLKISYGLNGVVHLWISSYIANRTQYVRCPGSRSIPLPVLCGVPQGSVLGPLLFLLYTADLVQLVESFGLHPQSAPVC